MTFYAHWHNFHIYLPRIFKREVEPVPDEGRRDIKPVFSGMSVVQSFPLPFP